MKSVFVLRHGKVGGDGRLTAESRGLARDTGRGLPPLARVLSSGAIRAIETAQEAANEDPFIDERAGFYLPVERNTPLIARLAVSSSVDFVEAAYLYGEGEFVEGMERQATEFNELVDEILGGLSGSEQALVVSHSTTIVPAMATRLTRPRAPLENLTGYQIFGDGRVEGFPAA